MEFSDAFKPLFIETAHALTGSARRLFMARTVKEIGPGSRRYAEREFGWNRGLIRKGTHELESGFRCLDAFSARGRKRAEAHLPHLLDDIRAIVDSQSQADPQFRTTRLSTRLSAAEVRRQLLVQKGYLEDVLPTVPTITTKLNTLGSFPKKVAKSQPQKNPPNRGNLRTSEPPQPSGRCHRGHVTPLHGCQGHSQNRAVFSGWQAPHTGRGS